MLVSTCKFIQYLRLRFYLFTFVLTTIDLHATLRFCFPWRFWSGHQVRNLGRFEHVPHDQVYGVVSSVYERCMVYRWWFNCASRLEAVYLHLLLLLLLNSDPSTPAPRTPSHKPVPPKRCYPVNGPEKNGTRTNIAKNKCFASDALAICLVYTRNAK